MKKELIDFNKYWSPKEVKDYELFIGPNGEYYKVKTKHESDFNCTHHEWAEKYLEDIAPDILDNPMIGNYCKTHLQALINYYGFVRYTHSGEWPYPFISMADFNLFGQTLNKNQVDSIFEIVNYNKETIDSLTLKMIDDSDARVYEKRIDAVFYKSFHE